MKFKTYLEQIKGVEVYPMVSLILFTVLFVAIVMYAFTADKETMDENARIPL